MADERDEDVPADASRRGRVADSAARIIAADEAQPRGELPDPRGDYANPALGFLTLFWTPRPPRSRSAPDEPGWWHGVPREFIAHAGSHQWSPGVVTDDEFARLAQELRGRAALAGTHSRRLRRVYLGTSPLPAAANLVGGICPGGGQTAPSKWGRPQQGLPVPRPEQRPAAHADVIATGTTTIPWHVRDPRRLP